MDAKGRLAVPSRYRDRLSEYCGGKLVITISLMERCLVAYPFPDWQRIEESLRDLPALDEQAQAINHLLIGHATEVDMDAQGRVLVSQSLRDFAALDKRIKMVGQVRKFELWDEVAWTNRREDYLGQVGKLQHEHSDTLRKLVL